MASMNAVMRKGGTVRCVTGHLTSLTRGKCYTLTRDFCGRSDERIYVRDDDGDVFDYTQGCFGLRVSPVAKPETPKPAEFVKGQMVECVSTGEQDECYFGTISGVYRIHGTRHNDQGTWLRFEGFESKDWCAAKRFRAVPAGMKRTVKAAAAAASSPVFNKGDIVECISDANKYVTQGSTYTVLGTYSSKYGDKILIKTDSDSLGNCRYPSREFKMFFASVEVTKTGSETVTKVPQSVEVTRKEEEDTKGGSNSMEQDNNSMMSTFKGYFKKNQDTLMTLGVVVLLDEFLLGGGLRDRIKRTIESILGGLEKRIAGDVDDGTTDDK